MLSIGRIGEPFAEVTVPDGESDSYRKALWSVLHVVETVDAIQLDVRMGQFANRSLFFFGKFQVTADDVHVFGFEPADLFVVFGLSDRDLHLQVPPYCG
jgi:hypothetical protein